ncbi:hypothetical protein QBC37DRAFT_447357 [Rhypophila decipiens]|uniref:Uncharacterized protein n=1 Tax=Rhypophila decipiens TaxID=261697 RepID=A0AAN7B305_9PEZI|nr:hypothetical protein QBC37DRAFT_447357 [Rhypophila decipiens]
MPSEPPPNALQTLADLGIVKIHQGQNLCDSTASYRKTVSSHGLRPAPSPGSLGQGFPQRTPVRPTPPRKQPTLFWKAMGFFMKRHFSSAADLEDDDQALFFADPNQSAIPAGGSCPPEVTNYQLLVFSDTIQLANRPSFSLSGTSYFEFLNIRMNQRSLYRPGRPSSPSRNKRMRTGRRLAPPTFNAAGGGASSPCNNKSDSNSPPAPGPLLDFIDHKSEAGTSYKQAFDEEEKAQENLTHLNPSITEAITRLMDQIRLADSRIDYHVGCNMPVVTVDADWIEMLKLMNSTNPGTDPSTMGMAAVSAQLKLKDLVYHRHLHEMNNYQSTVNTWYKSMGSPGNIPRDGPYRLDPAGIWERSWADLGHRLLDSGALPGGELTSQKKDFLNSLSATVTFIHKPFRGNITRGTWDVKNPRRFRLQPDAPPSQDERVYKTSRLIIAWGIKIELVLPEAVVDAASDIGVKNITLADLDLPLKEVSGEGGNKLIFSGGWDFDQSGGGDFPILLGAFADLV